MIDVAFFMALPARCTGTVLAKVCKFIMAGMSVRPSDVDTRSRGNMNLHIDWLLADVQWQRHTLH